MPIYDKALLTGRAKQLGFITAQFEKMSRLTEVLRFLNESGGLRKTLALKGGTAINLTVFNLPRLSVDIDLDFTENIDRNEIGIKRKKISELLELYMTAEGYLKKEKSKNTHILDSFVYSYTNMAGNSDNIKVEINYSLRSHVFPAIVVTSCVSEISDPFPIRTLAPVEIFASKIVALSERAAARDLYDLNSMIYCSLFSETDLILLRKCAVFYMAIAGDISPQGFSFKRADDITPYKVKTDLYPMIRNSERFDLRAAHDRVSAFLSERMALTAKESAFLKQFAVGRYEPELLFEDSEIVKRIEKHQIALWRIQHIRVGRQER